MTNRWDSMRSVVADQWHEESPPPHWSGFAFAEVEGSRYRFGVANIGTTRFDDAADYNRNHVLVRVVAFSLNRWDRATFRDDKQSVLDSTRGIGSDFVAEILSMGSGVEDFQIGDRVMPCVDWPSDLGMPGARGFVSVNASREFLRLRARGLMRVPDSITDEDAAAMSAPAQTGFAMVRRLDPLPGQHVMICGAASDVGLAALGDLVCRGVTVSVLDADPHHVLALQDMGAVEVFDSDDAGFDRARTYAASVSGLDGLLDTRGRTNLHPVALLGFSGRYVTCGQSAAVDDQWVGAADSVVSKNITIMGNNLGTRADLSNAVDRVAEGRWKPVIDSVHTDGQLTGFVGREFGDSPRLGKVIFRYT